jgi:[protein-PII] uridylyltransferase
VVSHIYQRDELHKKQLLLAAENHGEYWSLLIMANDRAGLLNKICGVLALHQLTVLAAHIFTWPDGTVVDTMEVAPAVNREFADQDWERLKDDLFKAINFRLGLACRLERKLSSGGNRPKGGMQTRARVEIDTRASDTYTIIEVYAENRPGQLYKITRTLFDFGINTFKAKIGSEGDQVVDAFYVLDYEGKKIESPEYQREIHQGLLYAVS